MEKNINRRNALGQIGAGVAGAGVLGQNAMGSGAAKSGGPDISKPAVEQNRDLVRAAKSSKEYQALYDQLVAKVSELQDKSEDEFELEVRSKKLLEVNRHKIVEFQLEAGEEIRPAIVIPVKRPEGFWSWFAQPYVDYSQTNPLASLEVQEEDTLEIKKYHYRDDQNVGSTPQTSDLEGDNGQINVKTESLSGVGLERVSIENNNPIQICGSSGDQRMKPTCGGGGSRREPPEEHQNAMSQISGCGACKSGVGAILAVGCAFSTGAICSLVLMASIPLGIGCALLAVIVCAVPDYLDTSEDICEYYNLC